MNYYLAVDIGASSGRHILGHLDGGRLILEEIYRFENAPVNRGGRLCWDTDVLFAEVVNGLRRCFETGKIPLSMGVDTWGVDFVLLDKSGNRLDDCVAYRDRRTEGTDKLVEARISITELYSRTGIQKQIYNTIYQLTAIGRDTPELLERAEHLLMTPEYLNYLLTGVMMNEYTICSTTGLLNAAKRDWDDELLGLLKLPGRMFRKLHMPGTGVGRLSDAVRKQVGFDCTVILPPSHDTASAFLAVPAVDDTSVYISSGTWSLLGVENSVPVTTSESMRAGYTNEGGYECRCRYIKNIMGLWMIQSIRRELDKRYSFDELVGLARKNEEFSSVVDVNAPCFFAPDSMTGAIKQYCADNEIAVPQNIGETVRCVYNSLASCYADAIKSLESLTSKRYTGINIVGGGCQDDYLNELTAKTAGMPVFAGPIEGTAIGNILSQMLKDSQFADLTEARACVRKSFEIKKYDP